ncbi:MAG: BadF/BadG/BcrA/BcrD ATPase family protein [Candidatus Methylomirabilia bacterium]
MPRVRFPEDRVAIAVDLGGTHIRVVTASLATAKRWRLTARAPDPADLPSFLGRLWRRWGIKQSAAEALVVASRGVWTVAERKWHERRLRRLARRVVVLSDAEAAYLGALGPHPGLLVVAGTGSIVLGRTTRGRWIRGGGLGPLLGDEGSAFWIGREWLRTRAPVDTPTEARRFAQLPDAVARIAALAPGVLARARRGNRSARRIVAEAQRCLALLAVEAARAARLRPPIKVSWAGSLAGNNFFRAGLRRALRRSGLRTRLVPPSDPPVHGGLALALRLCRRRAHEVHPGESYRIY